MRKTMAVLLALLCCALLARGQDIRSITIEQPNAGQTIPELINSLEKAHQIRFFFRKDWLTSETPPAINYPVTLQQFLEQAFAPSGIRYFIRDRYVVLYPGNYEAINLANNLVSDESVVVVGNENAPLDVKAKMVGTVTDGQTGEPLPGAVVTVEQTTDGAVTDANGQFTFELYPGLYKLKVNFVGFEESEVSMFLKSSGSYDLQLFESSVQLDAVTIEEFAIDQNVNNAQISVANLDVRTIKSIPAFLGEADIIKSVLLLPGVSTVGEGSTGFNVRGGAVDQNLLIYDNAPIFNPSHLFGFFSNINPDAVKDITLYKGGIPARYGGRVSSVLEINSRNPSMEKFDIKGGIGLTSSRLTADIPLVKNKSALLIGGRASYIDWLLDAVKNVEVRRSSAQFYDLNGKWTANIGEKDFISVSGYISSDSFKFAADTTYGWETKNIDASWVHAFNKQLTVEVSAVSANYGYDVEGAIPQSEFVLDSRISNQLVSANVYYSPSGNHQLTFGGTLGRYRFDLGDLTPTGASAVEPINLDSEFAREQAVYIQDEYTVNKKLSIAAGVRFSNFDNIGPISVFEYSNDAARSEDSVIGSTAYSDGELVKRYNGLEPRFSLKYNTSISSSIKIGYNRTRQYIHTISNTAAITPIDVWKPSDNFIEPKIADQVSGGYFRNFKDNLIEVSAEAYYKKLQNELDFKNGASILLNENLERAIISGVGRSYGLELFLKKNRGRLSGWMSYTLSRTEKKIEGEFEGETINDGKYYPAEYDKPHNLSVVGEYQVSNRWTINGNFTYSTGRPLTGPDVKFRFNGNVLTYFAERNQLRIPNYHRLDIAFTYKPGLKKDRLWDGSWTLSFYNVYGRENAYSVFIGERRTSAPTAYKFSVLGSVFPSITYNFELK